MIHAFTEPVLPAALPELFTYPFHYTPHPLCVQAAEQVQAYLRTRTDWQEELQQGKMFGVLVVRTSEGSIGFLAAFSGILAGRNLHDYFVPPIYDLLQPQGFFRQEEEQISAINQRIDDLQADRTYTDLRAESERMAHEAAADIAAWKERFKADKARREQLRNQGPIDEDTRQALIRESQFQKAELKRREQHWKEQQAHLHAQVEVYTQQLAALKKERKQRSAALQEQLFRQFVVLNARGERIDLVDLFHQYAGKIPPAGAGECAAPKLLQYAYLHHLAPIAMAEFWWGASPKAEIRHHGYYYPACKGKCEPILSHMLQGLNVAPNPLATDEHTPEALETVYEDEYLVVVNKPAGMLSVPGKEARDSVYQRMRERYPQATGPLIVHRLDMSTSGLLLVAKSKEVHKQLQEQFHRHTICKQYLAVLEGEVTPEQGVIELPLAPDYLDRPRQRVDRMAGKYARTHYQVVRHRQGRTLIVFYPQTGRTHQLRVHAAHPEGLHCPIRGDELYGQKADRLYLHAEALTFVHPVTGQTLCLRKPIDFEV